MVDKTYSKVWKLLDDSGVLHVSYAQISSTAQYRRVRLHQCCNKNKATLKVHYEHSASMSGQFSTPGNGLLTLSIDAEKPMIHSREVLIPC